jgi:TRAP-type C4-dicarboxylate transport system permease small subunit
MNDSDAPGSDSALGAIRRRVLLVLEACCACAIALMVALLAIGGLERNITGTAFIGNSDELIGYLMAALFGFGVSVALADGGHVRVDLLYRSYKGRIKRVADGAFKGIGVLCAAALSGAGIALAYDSYARGRVHYGFVELPAWLPQSIIVVGALLFLLEFVFGEEKPQDQSLASPPLRRSTRKGPG